MNPRFEEILFLSHEVPQICVTMSYAYESKLPAVKAVHK